jgi:hypothetical protein
VAKVYSFPTDASEREYKFGDRVGQAYNDELIAIHATVVRADPSATLDKLAVDGKYKTSTMITIGLAVYVFCTQSDRPTWDRERGFLEQLMQLNIRPTDKHLVDQVRENAQDAVQTKHLAVLDDLLVHDLQHDSCLTSEFIRQLTPLGQCIARLFEPAAPTVLRHAMDFTLRHAAVAKLKAPTVDLNIRI